MSQSVPLARRPIFWAGAALGVLLLVAAFVVGMNVGGAEREPVAGASETPRPSPTAGEEAVEAEEPVDNGPLPADCSGLYTRDWAPDMAPLVLNPEWVQAPDSGFPRFGSNDPGLVTMLDGTTRVECNWVGADGPGGVFLVTSGALLTPEQHDEVIGILSASYTCYEELEGTRCIIEGEGDGGLWGESHFLRDDVWLATKWSEIAPEGYTHDMIAAVWG